MCRFQPICCVVGLGDDSKINWCEGVKESDFTGSAVETFGAKAVKDAYCLMLTFTLDESTWIGSLLTEPEGGYKPEMFSFVKPYMTPAMQKIWDEAIKDALNGDSEEASGVRGMTFFDFRTGPYELFMNGMVLNKRADLKELYAWKNQDGNDRLVMTLDVSGDLVLRSKDDGKLYLLPTKKTINYSLAENGLKELPWLIDGFDSKWWVGGKDNIKPMPDTSPSPSAQ